MSGIDSGRETRTDAPTADENTGGSGGPGGSTRGRERENVSWSWQEQDQNGSGVLIIVRRPCQPFSWRVPEKTASAPSFRRRAAPLLPKQIARR